jgi:hypothetical protein
VKRLALTALAALTLAPGAAAETVPVLPHGTPIAIYAPLRPTVIGFGDSLHLDLTVAVDRKQVDPATVELEPRFPPFDVVRPVRPSHRNLGELTLIRFPVVLRCIEYGCVPTAQTTLHHLRRGRVLYRLRDEPRTQRYLRLRLPAIDVVSAINPSLVQGSNERVLPQLRISPYAAHIVPVPKPTYRLDPAVVVGGSAAAAGLFLVAALLLGGSYVRRRLPRRAARPTATPLEQALAFLVWAREQRDETVRRKALERIAGELGRNGAPPDLARTAHRLAWAEEGPQRDEFDALADRVRREVRR